MTRIKDWTVENLTEEQKEIHDTIVSGPRGHVVGPLRIWLNNPGLARSAQTVGEYARYGTSLSKGLSELAIITTGRVWSSAFGGHGVYGMEAVRFYTRLKTVTGRWPSGHHSGAQYTFPSNN